MEAFFRQARVLAVIGLLVALSAVAPRAHAAFHLFRIEQIYSNADGTVQFVVLHEAFGANGENLWANHALKAVHGGVTNTFRFPGNLPNGSTAGRRVLVGTQGFAALGIVTPDYVMPNNFLPTDGGTLNYADVDFVNYAGLPADGVNAIDRNGSMIPNLATNFAGQSASVVPPPALFANYQGLWWAAPADSESGWGINFNHQGNTIFATWFTYDLNGKPTWLVVSATSTPADPNTFTGTLVSVTGPPFNAFDRAQVMSVVKGTATFAFTDANTAIFSYTVDGISQSKTITREIFAATVPSCTFGGQPDFAAATNYQDIWWNAPAGSESGWGVNLNHQGDTIFATWFTFGLDGNVLWLVVAANKTGPGVYTGTLVEPTGGPPFNARPFDPALVTGDVVGTVTLTFVDGNNATFAYEVNGIAQVKNITRQTIVPPGTLCQ
jgi:hypothetical protein